MQNLILISLSVDRFLISFMGTKIWIETLINPLITKFPEEISKSVQLIKYRKLSSYHFIS